MEFDKSEFALREVNCNVLIDLAKDNQNIVVLDSDLLNASGLIAFQKKHPERTFNCGIQECNMVGVAGGLSAMGFIPVIHSFAAFASRRAVDQVFMSGVYSNQNIKILGSDPGVCGSSNGGSHMALEDIAIMRAMPNMMIIDPTDETMLKAILPQIINTYGMCYIRLYRKTQCKVYKDDTQFELGKAQLAKDGTDVTIIAEGSITTPESLKAAESLHKEGYDVRVLDMFTISPLDTESIIKAAKETGAIVSVENHNINNGLGSAIAEVLAENRLAIPFTRLGFKNSLGETADIEFLSKKHGIDSVSIANAARQLMKEK